MRKLLLLATLVPLLSGCADLFIISRSIDRGELARLGAKPGMEERRALALSAFQSSAFDPESVQVRAVSDASPGWMSGGLWGWILGGEGWYWTAELNGKNRFGGYVGFRGYRFLYDPQGKTWMGSSIYEYDVDPD